MKTIGADAPIQTRNGRNARAHFLSRRAFFIDEGGNRTKDHPTD